MPLKKKTGTARRPKAREIDRLEIRTPLAEEALQESHARLELALDSAAMGAWAYDIPSDLRDFDARTCRILGLDPASFRGTTEEFFAAIHPEDRSHVRAAMARTIGEGLPYGVTYRVVLKDGSVRQISVRGTLTRGPDGRALKISGIAWDDSERKRAEELLRESEKRLSDVIYSSADWIWEVDAAGVYIYSSQKGSDVLGWSAEELLGKTPFDFMPPEEAARIGPIFAGIAAAKAPIRDLENWNITKDGRRICLLTNGVPVLDAEGGLKGYRGVDKDITERKKAEEQIRQSLREKEILLREIYHRTKNNMNVINSLLSLREESLGDPAAVQTFKDIEDRIQAMSLVHQKLYQSHDLSRIDMREYLVDLAGLLTKTIPGPAGRLALEFDLAPLRLPLDAAIPLGLIVTELFSNIVKHALKGDGRVTIRLGLRPADAECLELTVADDGPGPPPGFDFRASRTMGLQTVRMLVEHQLQGRCEFESGPGVTCRIRIPRPDETGEDPA